MGWPCEITESFWSCSLYVTSCITVQEKETTFFWVGFRTIRYCFKCKMNTLRINFHGKHKWTKWKAQVPQPRWLLQKTWVCVELWKTWVEDIISTVALDILCTPITFLQMNTHKQLFTVSPSVISLLLKCLFKPKLLKSDLARFPWISILIMPDNR